MKTILRFAVVAILVAGSIACKENKPVTPAEEPPAATVTETSATSATEATATETTATETTATETVAPTEPAPTATDGSTPASKQ